MRSRGVYRGIFSALPDDPDFQRLTPNARLALYTCRVCAQAGPAVIFRYYHELLCAQTGLRASALEAALVDLESGVWIAREGVVLWVRNGLRYDPYINLSNEKQKASVTRWLEGLPRVALVLKFCDYYEIGYPFDTHSIGSPTVSPPISDIRVPKKTDIRVPSAEKKTHAVAVTDDDFVSSLETNVVYQGINVRQEHGRMLVWLGLPKNTGKQATRSRFVNWLNRCERPMTGNGHQAAKAPMFPTRVY